MLTIAPSTQLLGLKPEVFPGLMVAGFYFLEERKAVTLKACVNGAHTPGSLHYAGYAFDLDIPGATEEEMIDFESDLREILGKEYSVLFQGSHIHIHWSPRTGVNRS